MLGAGNRAYGDTGKVRIGIEKPGAPRERRAVALTVLAAVQVADERLDGHGGTDPL